MVGILITPIYPFSSVLLDNFADFKDFERSTEFNNTYVSTDGCYFVTGRSKQMLKDVELICQNLDGEFESIMDFKLETLDLIKSNL